MSAAGIEADIRTALTRLTEIMDRMQSTDLDPEQQRLMETGRAAAEDLVTGLEILLAGGSVEKGAGGPVPPFPPPAGGAEGPDRRLKVLLAEDNPLNQKLVVSILRNRGHDVVVVADGRQAVAAAREKTFDLILMDIQMPAMDGFEATRRIRAWERETASTRIPVVAVTAHVLEEEKERCFSTDMDGFVGKPIRRNEFLAVVEGIAGEEGPALDRSALMAIVGGNQELIAELIDLYWQSFPDHLDNLRKALDDGDAEQCAYWAHAIKGMSLNLSARQTAGIALEMELLGKKGDLSTAEGLWQRLTTSVDRLRRATDGLLDEMALSG